LDVKSDYRKLAAALRAGVVGKPGSLKFGKTGLVSFPKTRLFDTRWTPQSDNKILSSFSGFFLAKFLSKSRSTHYEQTLRKDGQL
jgi:hypothetical protein